MRLIRKFAQKFTFGNRRFLYSAVVVGMAIALYACGSNPSTNQNIPASQSNIPVFLFLQASPDGKTIEGIVPSDLVERLGSLERVIQSLPTGSEFAITQYGKTLATFKVESISGSDVFGAIASFRLQSANAAVPAVDPQILRQPNLTIILQNKPQEAPKNNPDQGDSKERNYFFNCPNKIQPLILAQSRNLFTQLGVDPQALSRVTLASKVCVDLDGDQQPEIVAGLRLDNLNRPETPDASAWSSFLTRSALERQEYSLLVLLRKAKGENWVAEPIISQTRALSYINDSASSYILSGLQDLNADRFAEIVVKEIGLNSIDAKVISLNIDAQGKWQWRNYYQNQRSLNIVQ